MTQTEREAYRRTAIAEGDADVLCYLDEREAMAVHITFSAQGRQITLTTEHSASSYGIPVAIIDGRAYGPDDVLAEDAGPAWLEAMLSEMIAEGLLPEAERCVGRLVAHGWDVEHANKQDGPNAFGCEARVTGGDCLDGYEVGGWEHSAECAAVRRFCAGYIA